MDLLDLAPFFSHPEVPRRSWPQSCFLCGGLLGEDYDDWLILRCVGEGKPPTLAIPRATRPPADIRDRGAQIVCDECAGRLPPGYLMTGPRAWRTPPA
jgi:hypothetical protein